MRTSNNQAETYRAPAIEVLAVESGRTMLQESLCENPTATGENFGEPIIE